MELVKFSTKLSGKDPTQPPFRIPAADLDSNFAKLTPLKVDGNKRPYAIEETPEGWLLRLFPDSPNTAQIVGQLEPIEVERCDGKKMYVLGTGWK